MRHLFIALFAFACASVSAQRVFSSTPTISLGTGGQTFENTKEECAKNDTCDLKQIFFRKEDYFMPADTAELSDPIIYGTKMIAGYITHDVEQLTNYLFVQFNRGCMWYSHLDEAKQHIVTEFGIVREYLGVRKTQNVFPEWVVDTNDNDPAATSGEVGNRHFLLQWSEKVPLGIPNVQGNLFGEKRPTIPFGYITDMPGPAVYAPGIGQARNMSLEFKTCLFKTKDVSLVTNGHDVDVTRAVFCINWESKFVYDHKQQKFETPKGIHQECGREWTVREKFVREHSNEKELKILEDTPAKEDNK